MRCHWQSQRHCSRWLVLLYGFPSHDLKIPTLATCFVGMHSPSIPHLQTQLQNVVPVVSLLRPCPHTSQLRRTPRCHLAKQHTPQTSAHKRGLVRTEAAGLDEGLSTSNSLLGPSTKSQRKGSSPEATGSLEGVELASEVPCQQGLSLCCPRFIVVH